MKLNRMRGQETLGSFLLTEDGEMRRTRKVTKCGGPEKTTIARERKTAAKVRMGAL